MRDERFARSERHHRLRWRLVPLLWALALMIAGCAIGTDDEAESDSGGTTDRTRTTSTRKTTTTRKSTTTESAPSGPWTTLSRPPAPGAAPLLLLPAGSPPVTRVCLDTQMTGAKLFGEESLRDDLAVLGITLTTGECDATLRVVGEGTRKSAAYHASNVPVGGASKTCWTGTTATGTVTLDAGGRALATWPFAKTVAPPSTISGCPAKDDPVTVGTWALDEPMAAMFGPQGRFVWPAGETWDALAPTDLVSDEVVQRIIALLAADETTTSTVKDRVSRVEQFTADLEKHQKAQAIALLKPVTPHLIAQWPEGSRSTDQEKDVQKALERITGQAFQSQAEAWAWWEAQS